MAQNDGYLVGAKLLRELKRAVARNQSRTRRANKTRHVSITGGGNSKLVHFELNENLPLGGDSVGQAIEWNGTTFVKAGDPFKVIDWTGQHAGVNGIWAGKAGYRGWCQLAANLELGTGDLAEYNVVWMENKAERIVFQLHQSLDGGSSEVTVLAYWRGINPGGGTDPVVVVDPGAAHGNPLFKACPGGAIGIAHYDDVDGDGGCYIVENCTSLAGWVRARLHGPFEDGTGGRTAMGTVLDWGGSQQDYLQEGSDDTGEETEGEGGEITIIDPCNHFLGSLEDAECTAIFNSVDNTYIAVECQTQAGDVEFQLTSAFSSGSASATIIRYYGSQQDVLNPGDGTGSSITIYNELGILLRTKSGAKGIARYDAVANKYRLILVEQIGFEATATLSGALCGGSTASITGFAITSPTPFNLSPSSTPTSANNPYAHRGVSGVQVQLALNGSNWDIIDIGKSTRSLLLDLRLDGDKLQGFKVDAAVEICEDPEWEDILDTTDECEA